MSWKPRITGQNSCSLACGDGAEASIAIILLALTLSVGQNPASSLESDTDLLETLHMSDVLLIFSVGVVAGIIFGILMVHERAEFTDFMLSPPTGSGMALAKNMLREQQRVGEHHT